VVAAGVTLKRHGKDLLGLCPLHDDHEPSLVVSSAKNLWHCLGACQTGGTAIDWVMKRSGVSFRHAVELLRADHPSLVAPLSPQKRGRQQGAVPKKATTTVLAAPFAPSADDAAVMRQVVDFYAETLAESDEARGYLERRGIGSAEAIEHFHLGYANRTLGYRLPEKSRRAGAELRGRLEKLGIYRESGHEHLAGSVVVPLFDANGNVVQLYGRKVNDTKLRAGTPMHLYLPGAHRGMFNREAFAADEIILCEALFDALSFWCAGIRNVTSCYGVSGFTDELREAFGASSAKRVYIAFDRDKAGDAGAEKVGAELAALGIEVMRVLFPHGMDANEYALKVTPASESLRVALRGAAWLAGTRRTVSAPTTPAMSATEDAPTTDEPEGILPLVASSAPPAATPLLAASTSHSDANERDEIAVNRTLAAPIASAAAPGAPVASARAHFDRERDEVHLDLDGRRRRVRGLAKNTAPGALRVNLLVSIERGGFHVDTLELYSARQRQLFVKMAADDLGAEEGQLKKEMGLVLLELERLQHELASTPKASAPALSESERAEALALLCDPKLIERIIGDFDKLGIVGERTNKLVAFLAATSRKLDQPLAVVIQSSSAAGKSSLMEAVLSLMPDEERVQYSAMTGQSLFYMGEQDLRHKILAIVEEEGAERASYALKLLQSEGELTIASTGKDPQSGRLVTHEYRVEGPVMIMLTTTAIDVDEELLNRCIVLSVDEGRKQTRAIHERQRRAQTLAGLLEREERSAIVKLHRNAQRLLQPLVVVNPFAEKLGFADHVTRTRRDHMKYLTLIRAVALLHQHQRPVKEIEHRGKAVRYIEVVESDIALADRICERVLARALDELPTQTRRLLGEIEVLVNGLAKANGGKVSDVRFSRRMIHEHTGWGLSQLKVHLHRLEEHELLLVHAGGPRRRLLYEYAYDPNWPGAKPNWPGSGRPVAGGGGRPEKMNGTASLAHLAGVVGPHYSGDGEKNRTVVVPLAKAAEG
jgi:DNA primase